MRGHARGGRARTPFYLAPLGKVARDNLLNVVADVDAADVERVVLAHERAHAPHVVAIVAELVAAETVNVGVEEVVDGGQAVQVLALLAARTQAARKEQAKVRARYLVGLGVAAVLDNVAAPGCVRFRYVFVFAVATRPLVVPDVEDRSRLRRYLTALECFWVHLRARWAALLLF